MSKSGGTITVYRFAEALHCSADYLLGLSDTLPSAKKRLRPRTTAPVG